jgi:hypothetical protein
LITTRWRSGSVSTLMISASCAFLDQRRQQRGAQVPQLGIFLLERRLAHQFELELALVGAQALVLGAHMPRLWKLSVSARQPALGELTATCTG